MTPFNLELIAATSIQDRLTVKDPDWATVEQGLIKAYELGGGVWLHVLKAKQLGVRSLEFRSEPRQFLLIAGRLEGRPIRWRDQGREPGTIEIGGDEWDARSVISDLSIAIRVFKEVFDAGELSADSLSHMS